MDLGMYTYANSFMYDYTRTADVVRPPDSELDAKKSPLALLAQTCSSIGKDSTPSKPIIPPLEKKSDSQSNGTAGSKPGSPATKNHSASEENKSQSAGSSHAEKREGSPGADSSKSSFRAPPPKDIPPLVPISGGGSNNDRKSPCGSSSSLDSVGKPERDSTSAPGSTSHSANNTTSTAVSSNSRISLSCGNMLLEVNHQESGSSTLGSKSSAPSSSTTPTLSSFKQDSLAALASSASMGMAHSFPTAGYPCGIPMLGHHYAVDPTNPIHPTAISAAHNLGLSKAMASGLAGAPGMSPYSYARVKTTAGATTLVPICRDPYCTNCQITMQNAQLAQVCAAGCTQCNHEKAFTNLPPTGLPSGISTSLGTMPMLPYGPGISSLANGPGSSSALHLQSLYPHSFGVLPGHHTLPYVCNWMAGSDYCGKRFATSEELLQHLRSHTSSGESSLSSLGLTSPFAGLGSAAAYLGCPSHYPAGPGSLSPNSLRQAYPRSFSPNTLLAANRYHPYKSPLSAAYPTAAALQNAAAPAGLGAFYSPYALYGQRLGAAVAP